MNILSKISVVLGACMLVCGCSLWSPVGGGNTPAAVVEPADPAARWRKLDLNKYADANTILLDDIHTV